MKWFLYNVLFALAYCVVLPSFLLRMKRRGGYRARMGDRFARYPEDILSKLRSLSSPIWIHAVTSKCITMTTISGHRKRILKCKEAVK